LEHDKLFLVIVVLVLESVQQNTKNNPLAKGKARLIFCPGDKNQACQRVLSFQRQDKQPILKH
jgi:hypothetical protein